MKSLCGGLGISPMQEQRESSSDPNPLYGGMGRGIAMGGSALYLMGVKSSAKRKSHLIKLQIVIESASPHFPHVYVTIQIIAERC